MMLRTTEKVGATTEFSFMPIGPSSLYRPLATTVEFLPVIAVSTAAENSTFTLNGMPAVAGLAGIGMSIAIGTSILIFPLSTSSATPPARLTVSPFTPVR